MENIDYSEIKSFKDLKKDVPKPVEIKHSEESVKKIKKKADRAFGDGKFTKAYGYYNQLMLINPGDYDILACLIGTALNLGYLDEVFSRSDHLIQLDEKKAQGYYLKGIANDILFNFEHATELFLKALEFEKDHSKLIVKNLTKSIAKLINVGDYFQMEDNDDEPEATYLLKLIEITEFLIKKRKIKLSIKVLNYIETLESKNYLIKTEFLLTSGNLFKVTQTYEKALLAFEECLYLAGLNDDHKLKIKALVSISSCYLQLSDLHKVIYYYHKILDIETDLIFKNSNKITPDLNCIQFNDELINLELRIAVRQNLFTAHYRLGKLRLCCHYLSEMVIIIDNQLGLNFSENTPEVLEESIFELFEYVQIKMDASIELCKFYILFKDFSVLEALLTQMLKFTEVLIEKGQKNNQLNDISFNNLKHFKIRCYSYMGICQAGLREFRFSKLCTKKCLTLIEKEIKQQNTKNDGLGAINSPMTASDTSFDSFVSGNPKSLSLINVECLLNASEAMNQIVKTFKEMKDFDFRILSENPDDLDEFSKAEVAGLMESYEQRITYAKQAYMISKGLIDPNLRAQTTFELAMSLYDNELYQSAAYYFNEVLSISTILLDSTKPLEENSDYLKDIKPDYHLEAFVYFTKCQLIVNYYQNESCVNQTDKKLASETDSAEAADSIDLFESEAAQLDNFYKKLVKTNDLVSGCILKWKLTETNRASFKFNLAEAGNIKEDTDCERLRKVLEICGECLIYICYKLEKFEDCLFYLEHNKYLLNLDLVDLNERLRSEREFDVVKLIESGNVSLLKNDGDLKQIIQQINDSLVVFKFIFDCKLMFVFHVDSSGEITFKDQIKLSVFFNKYKVDVDGSQRKLNNSEIDYFSRNFHRAQNDWIKQHLSEIECRDISSSSSELKKLRGINRIKEKKVYDHINGFNINDTKGLRNKLVKNSIDRKNFAQQKPLLGKYSNSVEKLDSMLANVLYPIFIDFLKVKLNEKDNFINVSIDSPYAGLLTYTLNSYNSMSDKKFCYNLILDSFLLAATSTLIGVANEKKIVRDINETCQNIKNTPNIKPISKKLDMTNSVKILKSNVIPRYTSHPRLAVTLLNEDPEADYVIVRSDHVDRAKYRMDASVGTLISDTYSGTDAKHSNLQIVDYKQVYKPEKCSVIGCPDVPKVYLNKSGVDKFLKNGFDQLCKVAKLLYTNPIYANKMTKQELINQLESSKVVFLSTISSNQSDTSLICSENQEYPSSRYEIDKYCKLSPYDLNLISMKKCDLLVLNCFSTVNHVPRMNIAKKLLSRGCKNVLIVLSPLTDELASKFFYYFFENLRIEQNVSVAYNIAISSLLLEQEKNSEDKVPKCPKTLKNMINSSFCLLGSKQIKVSINEIAKLMIQQNIDAALEELQIDKNYLNSDLPLSILSPSFKSWLEKTLIDLQVLFKLLIHQLITESSDRSSLKNNEHYRGIFYCLYDLVSKSIYYMKNKKVEPEELPKLIMDNKNAENILICLGFNTQRSTVSAVRDQPDKKFLTFPDNRFLDLSVRTVHILGALIEICFEQAIENQPKPLNDYSIRLDEASYMNQFYEKSHLNTDNTEYKIKMIILNLQALLPVNDKSLLTCLIDIIALTKFSSEIILSITDSSVYYAFHYYEKNSKLNSKEYLCHLNKDIDAWSKRITSADTTKSLVESKIKSSLSGKSHATKFSRTNKVVNFLYSIGFELVGDWLRFNDIGFNRRVIELMLKLFTSFAQDRDMTLYKELNINVMGQRSAVTRERYSFIRANSGLTNQSEEKATDHFQNLIGKPWNCIIESQKEMAIKLEFMKEFVDISNKLSKQRVFALKHYLNYTAKQNAINILADTEENLETSRSSNPSIKKVKFKPGGGPSKTREIVNEKYNLTHEQINQIRKLSFLFCQKSIVQIDVDLKEKTQKLLLPIIKNKVYNL